MDSDVRSRFQVFSPVVPDVHTPPLHVYRLDCDISSGHASEFRIKMASARATRFILPLVD